MSTRRKVLTGLGFPSCPVKGHGAYLSRLLLQQSEVSAAYNDEEPGTKVTKCLSSV